MWITHHCNQLAQNVETGHSWERKATTCLFSCCIWTCSQAGLFQGVSYPGYWLRVTLNLLSETGNPEFPSIHPWMDGWPLMWDLSNSYAHIQIDKWRCLREIGNAQFSAICTLDEWGPSGSSHSYVLWCQDTKGKGSNFTCAFLNSSGRTTEYSSSIQERQRWKFACKNAVSSVVWK